MFLNAHPLVSGFTTFDCLISLIGSDPQQTFCVPVCRLNFLDLSVANT